MKRKKEASLRSGIITFCKLHFLLIGGVLIQTVIYDASKLITPEVVLERWLVISGLLAVNSIIWYLTVSKAGHMLLYKSLLGVMIFSDILMASYFVYSGRGMASRAVIFYVLPIIIAGLLKSRSAIFATAILSIAAYSLAAVSYFVINFNEGYKVELYGEVGFFSFILLLLASFISKVFKTHA